MELPLEELMTAKARLRDGEVLEILGKIMELLRMEGLGAAHQHPQIRPDRNICWMDEFLKKE